jgi:hypothetical protein
LTSQADVGDGNSAQINCIRLIVQVRFANDAPSPELAPAKDAAGLTVDHHRNIHGASLFYKTILERRI